MSTSLSIDRRISLCNFTFADARKLRPTRLPNLSRTSLATATFSHL